MHQFTRFSLPLCMVVDEGVFGHTDEILEDYMPGITKKKAILVTEEFLKNTYSDIVREICDDFGEAPVFTVSDADYETASALAKKISMESIGVVIGFGGGRVLDTAKYAAHISKAVYICLPTTLSNDSLASPFSVLTMEGRSRKTLPCKIPTAIIVDTEMIRKAPVSQTMSGIGDTIGKYTAVYDWAIAAKAGNARLDDFAYSIASMCCDSIMYCDEKSIQSKHFMTALSRALVMGGLAMEIAGSSRPCSGSEHLFAHAIEEYYPDIKISHGLAVALGCVGAANFQGRDDMKIIEVCKKYGLDLNPETYGMSRDMFADIWMKAPGTRPDRVSILNDTELNREWIDEIYSRMQK